MPSYQAPLKDMQFVLHELWNIQQHIQNLAHYRDLDPDIIDPILEEAARFVTSELVGLNQKGDQEGCHFEQGNVRTPAGFKEAYHHLVEGGWMTLNADPAYGGQGLPKPLQVLLDEMLCSANVSFSLYTVLTQGAAHALATFGTESLKQTYLPKLISGEWSGTMCLTESHCGTDLGLLRTKAEPIGKDTYAITGTKIFITSGEHDLTENIIHTVLARLPDAPAGVKGISLFLVPKYLVNADGTLGDRNPVFCGAIEHKMGIKGSATCVLNFEGAQGYLIGEKNQGLKAMFSMMNLERLNIGLEGLGLAETAYQNALSYGKDRLQGRGAKGAQYPEKPADPIIVHPDVRRMLLTMKAFTEGARALAIWIAMQIDIAKWDEDAHKREEADSLVALLTPVIKAFFTDKGFEACNLGLQVLGGHGYIAEWGMEQLVRDARIAQIYEGTNGVQALDLVKRKLIGNDGASLKAFIAHMLAFVHEHKDVKELQEFSKPLAMACQTLIETSDYILAEAKKNADAAGAASTDYLHMLGLVTLAFMWAKMAHVALLKQDDHFYQAKLETARFYMGRVLPQVMSLQKIVQAGSESLMRMAIEMF